MCDRHVRQQVNSIRNLHCFGIKMELHPSTLLTWNGDRYDDEPFMFCSTDETEQN